MKHSPEENKKLCEKYPFLIPSNRWSGKRITEAKDGGYWPGSPESIPEYNYEYTELDQMPDGWRKAFGESLCDELKTELEKNNLMDSYRITQIKEKYGSLRWYDNGITSKGHSIIQKYSKLSSKTCIDCGKAATRITVDWISPYCNECCPDSPFILIEEYFSEIEDE